MSTKRTILFTTGIRSDYDILYSVMRAVDQHPNTETNLVITGAHLAELYGHTVEQVERDGFRVVARIESLLNSDTAAGRVKSAAIQLISLVDVFAQVRPDIAVAMADREEALTVAMAGAYMGIPVAHIGGGDHADDSNVDNAVRHAVTKLAHLHLVTTPLSAERVIHMGEEPWRVHVVGASGLDRLLTTEGIPPDALSEALDFDVTQRPLAVVIQHSISTEIAEAGLQMRTTLEAIARLGIRTLISYPNSDAGSHQIVRVIEEFAARYPFMRAYRNLSRPIFVNLLRRADVLVGNSSCGIIEAPLLKLPAVNVGRRQVGREHAENVLFVPHDIDQIQAVIRKALQDPEFKARVQTCQNPYGDGHAGERIAGILAEIPLNERLVSKRNTF
jgi:GDP/UDP-N,N'-diacetylbacillosamine 2-epimerase (hydrolysing)